MVGVLNMPIDRNDPEARQRLRDYQRVWAQRPEVKARRKARESTPEKRAQISARDKAYRSVPENAERKRLKTRERKRALRATLQGWLKELE